jgi:hypothetical protein
LGKIVHSPYKWTSSTILKIDLSLYFLWIWWPTLLIDRLFDSITHEILVLNQDFTQAFGLNQNLTLSNKYGLLNMFKLTISNNLDLVLWSILKSPHAKPLTLKDIKIDAWDIIISYGSNWIFQFSSVHDLFHEILLQARMDYPSFKDFHAWV